VKVLREGFGDLAGDGDADAAVDDDPPEEEELPPPKVPSFTKDLRSLLESFSVAVTPPALLLLLPLPKTALRDELEDEEAKTNGCFVFREEDKEEEVEEKKPKLPVEADLLTDSSRWSRISATSRVRSMICSGVYPASNSICVLVRTERTILRRAALPPFDEPEDRSIAEDETILRDAVIFRNCSYSSRSQV